MSRLPGPIAAIALLVSLTSPTIAADRTDFVYARNVSQGGTNWSTPGQARYDPGCGGACACGSSDCAVNTVSGNREWLRATNFEAFPDDLLDGSRWIRRVTVNVHGKHASGSASTWEFRVIVRDGSGAIVRDEVRTATFTNTANCDYRIGEPQRDITALWDWNEDAEPLDDEGDGEVEVWVRRGNNNSTMSVNAFRIRVDSEDLPECDVAPLQLDFGALYPGQIADRSFTLTNIGGGQLRGTIDDSDCPSAHFAVVAGGGTYDLGPGQSRTVTARYAPTDPDEVDEGCYIDLGDSEGDCEFVDLAGSVISPCVLDPSALDFGAVPVGASAERSFSVLNAGAVPMSGTVEQVASPFEVIVGAGPFVLQGGRSMVVTVRYSPESPGPDTDEVDAGSECLVALHGEGLVACATSTSQLDFGAVGVGEYADRSFTIQNTSSVSMSGEVRLLDRADTLGFTMVVGGGAYTLAAGGSRAVTVRFAPLREPGEVWAEVGAGASCPGSVDLLAYVALDAPERLPRQSGMRLVAPNPSHGTVRLEYALAQAGPVRLTVFDALGRRVRALLDMKVAAGTHQLTWDGRDERGLPVRAGLYLAELAAGGGRWRKSVLVVR